MEKYFSWLFFFFLSLLLILFPQSPLSNTFPRSIPPPPPKCREDEQSALLEFKEGFRYPINSYYASDFDDVRFEPWKLHTWKLNGEDGNCCTWDGVECDAESGHVIGLDLCCTGLLASINSSSSLFRLVHLQKLNLAYTFFNASPIPSSIGDLPSLTSLNLSWCGLTGQIPQHILGLANLSSLDLSNNDGLELVKPSLEDLAQRLTKLEVLDLTNVGIRSPLPHAITNLSSLTMLTLRECGLEGRLPLSVFSIPNLQVLDLSSNSISGHLPEIHQGSRLKSLFLDDNNLFGELSSSISNLTELVQLSLSLNRFIGPIPVLANMTQLNSLDLRYNTISGGLSPSLENLTQLKHLGLSFNRLTGGIPSQLLNLSQLNYLDLSFNMLSGSVHLDEFIELRHLEVLLLGSNNLSVVANSNTAALSHSSKLMALELASCKLREFPKLLLHLQQLSLLDLSSNNIHGQVPIWFRNVSRQNLMFLNLSSNSLTGLEGNSVNLKWGKLAFLDLSSNKLQGPLPLPPESISVYFTSNNRLSGNIPSVICSWKFIEVLDLAKNNFTGVIPRCFSSLSNTMTTLSLHDNNLQGGIPQVLDKNCSIRMLDLNNNKLQGPLPRTLSSCADLEFLNVGNNMIEDTFPSWLGAITSLRVLILRSNRFHGAIEEPRTSSEFQGLQIIDLSRNNFENYLPAMYLQYWTSMKEPITEGEYFDGDGDSPTAVGYMGYTYDFTLTIMNKGMEMEYVKILRYLQAIDFSGNSFSGEIPESIATLKGLRLLNFSNNNLSGPIPPVLGGLTNMESLDLSGNRFSGEIPQQLTQLNFLAFFNVSNNQLSGPIPRGTQFDTFKNTSYEGNEGLCGVPLSRTCGSVTASPPASSPDQKEKGSDAPVDIEWKAVVVGYVAGFVIAAVIGHKVITSRPDWISRALGFVERRRWI